MKANCQQVIKKECILGVNTDVRSVYALPDDQVLYCCTNQVVIWRRHERMQIFLHQCCPLEHVHLISVCSSRKTIAVVVKGKKDGPYIVLYDAQTHRRKKVFRHTGEDKDGSSSTNGDSNAGIITVSFSKDGKQCLVLYDEPDYLLSLWNIEKNPKMVASIRLATPSGKRIRRADMCPTDNRVICVSGNGTIRFFRVIDNIFRPVTVHLKREQQNYLHHCWLTSGTVVLATDKNELVVVQNFEAKVVISINDWKEQYLTAMAPFSKGLMIGSSHGLVRLYYATDEEQVFLKVSKDMTVGEESEILSFDKSEPENTICLLSSGRICNLALSYLSISNASDYVKDDDIVPRFHQHKVLEERKRIVCMDTCVWKTLIATGGSDCTVRIWNYKSKTFELLHTCKDKIMDISLHPMALQIIICMNKYVELYDVQQHALSPTWRKDIVTSGSSFSNGGHYFALCIGEFVQVYNTYTQDLHSTLRGHTAPVQSVCWKSDDLRVATIGKDSVVCVYDIWSGERLVRIATDVHTYCDGFLTEDFSTAVINTSAGVKVLDIKSKAFVPEYDAAAGSRVVSCVSNVMVLTTSEHPGGSGEVWIRNIFEHDSESRIPRLCLHSQQISCAQISREHGYIFTASHDGSLCISTFSHRMFPQREYKFNETVGPIILKDFLIPSRELGAKYRCIASLREKINETRNLSDEKFHYQGKMHMEIVNKLKQEIKTQDEHLALQIQNENNKLIRIKDDIHSDMMKEVESRSSLLRVTKETFSADLQLEKRKAKELLESHELEIEILETDVEQLIQHHKRETDERSFTYETKIDNAKLKADNLKQDKVAAVALYESEVNAIEQQTDIELTREQQTYESASHQEIESLLRLKEENNIMKKKYDALVKDFEEHKELISSLQEKQLELDNIIRKLTTQKVLLEESCLTEDREIMKLEREIISLAEKNHQMQRSKLTQTKLIKQMKENLNQKESELQILYEERQGLSEMLSSESKLNQTLTLKAKKEQLKQQSMKNEYETKASQLRSLQNQVVALQSKINKACTLVDSAPALKKYLIDLSKEYFFNKRYDNNTEQKNITQREHQVLSNKIKTTDDIMERCKKSLFVNANKLKNENKLLHKQLDELAKEIKEMTEKQSKVLN